MKRCFAGIWTTIALSIFAVSWHLSAQEDQELSSVGDDVVLRLHIPDIARSLQRLEQHPFRTLVTETDEGAIRGRWRQWMAMVEPLLRAKGTGSVYEAKKRGEKSHVFY